MPLRVSVQLGDGARSTASRAALALIERAAVAALEARGIADAELSVTLLGDRAIASLNQRWLDRQGPTDVIAFPLWTDGEMPVGDVYVGVRQAARQARENGIRLSDELARLAIHGTLHVLGLDHPDGARRTRSRMWREQEGILARVLAS